MKSKSLEEYLLSKYDVQKIEDLDLQKVEELVLNKLDINSENDYDFRDFEEFENLKYITLKNFKINNYETNELGRCKKLSAIQFSNCVFKSKSRLRGNIKLISINNCRGFDLRYLGLLKNLEVLKISNIKKINLKCANFYLKNLEKITFENTRVYNFGVLSKLKQLIMVEIINCKWNKKAVKLFSENVQIEE